jgi:tetratricopeptide (TPR) repeat protein
VTLPSLALVAGFGLIQPPLGVGDEPPKQTETREQAGKAASAEKAGAAPATANPGLDRARMAAGSRSDLSVFFGQPGDDPPRPFVPLRPATVDDRRRLEAVRLYSAARALEDQRAWPDAVVLLQEASKLDPDSVAIARRLCRIFIGALGRPDLALEHGRRVLAIEPSDTETLGRLVDSYLRKNDSAGAEALLNEVLANPKLDAHSPGRLLAEFELGKLYSTRLKQFDKAAVAFAKVIALLDDKSANRLAASDLMRVLGNDPATAYLNFGLVLLAAGRNELAVKALERGLAYDEENSQIALVLAETLLKLNKGDQALALVDRSIRRQPQGVEAYELLAKVLKALKREPEITPRLEQAAQRDSKNVPLQYVLADRYRETGQLDKADALYKSLLTSQPTPQTYRALAASLLKRKKAADLLKVICEALNRPNTQDAEAIKPQLLAAAVDDDMAEAMLDAGSQELAAHPPITPRSFLDWPPGRVLTFIANPERATANKVHRLAKLLKLQLLFLNQNPSSGVYSEVADTQRRMGRFAEAAATVEEMLAKYPDEKSVRILATLAELHHNAGHNEAAKATLRQAMKLDAADGESRARLANVFSQIGLVDDAAQILRDLSKKEPNNPLYDLTLGGILTKFGRNEEAIKVFQDMLKRFGGDDQISEFVRSSLSVVYVNQGDYAKGESELEILLQRNPDSPGPNNDLGYLYAEQGKNLEKAEAMIRKALEEDGDKYAYLDSLGWVLFKRGKVKEALKEMKKAADRMIAETSQQGSNPDATVLEHLGDVYFQLQEIDKAGDAWQQALKAAEQSVPPEKRLAEIRKKLDSLLKLGPTPKTSSNRTP